MLATTPGPVSPRRAPARTRAALPLSDATLPAIAARVPVPTYDRTALVPAVVHIGVGSFHRAHQALYLDELAAAGDTGWGVVGVGLRSTEMGEVLSGQDGLYTLVERGPDGERARVVGSLVDYLHAPEDPQAVLGRLADPRTRLVTLTVTGGGYFVDDQGAFTADDPDVQQDLADPQRPSTVVGFLVEALARRRDTGTGPFTVLSCDNLPDSGRSARTAVVSFARLRDAALADWIDTHVTFPSSMVDRITPQTSPEERDAFERTYGVADRWPVLSEPFRQWVVEDDFCAGRPPLDRVGVQFVDDVTPHKRVKTRLLNGGHCALGYLGTLAGHTASDEATADPVIGGYLERLLVEEIGPLLPVVEGMELPGYCDSLMARFANPAIADPLARLCRRGSTKMPSYLLPSLREAREQGRPHGLLVLAVAAWLRYLRGTDLQGRPLQVQDAHAERLGELARQGGDDPRPLLGERSVFGRLGDDEELVAEIGETLAALSRDGVAATVAACLMNPLEETR
ncbi:mannitol dehydrogenase family protein [Modestobacter sp. I12A-02628]|uniref:Mannitol-1-phosphate 5-dehydrogenase n=1 Tax=Goekera deserti TaxID=2497753 RepID=A0A7K3WJJ9_9ACTN|nr:mannitol dehydrogenase family protein [Goekera deserti]MPQ98970.1 mannitol dehydrogenase family protein [Goekera deserti]NDI50574.1 mannitol dehydrogenase family protein [Goekera deserti]NEL56637.1 mannitol dehydrogenase family protein [Goekera deserti]